MADEEIVKNENDQPYFFVSYSHDDTTIIVEQIAWLHRAGFNLWFDDAINVGSVWRQALSDAISGAMGTIFFSTASSINSDICQNELSFTLDQKKPVFVVQLDDTPLSGMLRFSLSDRQALIRSAYDKKTYQRRLTNALSSVAAPASRSPSNEAPTSSAGNTETDPPSIAVLPFVAVSQDNELTYLAHGITGDLVSKLSQRIWHIVAGQSDDNALEPKEVGSVRGVRYLLRGSLQKGGNRIRLTAGLTSAKTGQELWTQRYERSGDNQFDIQDELVNSIDYELFEAILDAESERLQSVPDEALDAWGLCAISGARTRMPILTRETRTRSRRLLELAIERDPNFAYAHSIYGWVVCSLILNQVSANPQHDTKLAVQHADKSLALAPSNMVILNNAAVVHRILGDPNHALHLAQLAAKIGGRVVAEVTSSLIALGRFEEALKYGESDPDAAPIQSMSLVNLVLARPVEAIRWARIGTTQQPHNIQYWVQLAAAQAASGDSEQALNSLKKVSDIAPKFTLDRYERGFRLAWQNREDVVKAVVAPLLNLTTG